MNHAVQASVQLYTKHKHLVLKGEEDIFRWHVKSAHCQWEFIFQGKKNVPCTHVFKLLIASFLLFCCSHSQQILNTNLYAWSLVAIGENRKNNSSSFHFFLSAWLAASSLIGAFAFSFLVMAVLSKMSKRIGGMEFWVLMPPCPNHMAETRPTM